MTLLAQDPELRGSFVERDAEIGGTFAALGERESIADVLEFLDQRLQPFGPTITAAGRP